MGESGTLDVARPARIFVDVVIVLSAATVNSRE